MNEQEYGSRRENTSRKLGSRIRLQWADRGSVHQRAYRKYTIAEKESTMDRISDLGGHKCRKGKISPDCPSDYSCGFTLDSSKGGGDSSHGKVSELTSSGIKRGSAAPWARSRIPRPDP